MSARFTCAACGEVVCDHTDAEFAGLMRPHPMSTPWNTAAVDVQARRLVVGFRGLETIDHGEIPEEGNEG